MYEKMSQIKVPKSGPFGFKNLSRAFVQPRSAPPRRVSSSLDYRAACRTVNSRRTFGREFSQGGHRRRSRRRIRGSFKRMIYAALYAILHACGRTESQNLSPAS